MKIRIFILSALVLLISGCATWQLTQSPYKWKFENLEANLPEGWMQSSYPSDILFLTKDGELLQKIVIFHYDIGKDKELPLTKKKFTAEMLPQEMATLIVNEMSLDTSKQNLKVTDNIPVEINNKDGFKLEYAFNTVEKLKKKSILYGFKGTKHIYLIQYEAAEQYYFNKDIATFNKFITDLKISK